MDVSELMTIVAAEDLDMPVIEGAGRLHLDAVVMQREGSSSWRVFLVDERHQPIAPTIRSFDSESDALEHVLRKLRQVQKSRRSMAALNARDAVAPERGDS
jgi:hypothetical protein